jgi:hypothetical protein
VVIAEPDNMATPDQPCAASSLPAHTGWRKVAGHPVDKQLRLRNT